MTSTNSTAGGAGTIGPAFGVLEVATIDLGEGFSTVMDLADLPLLEGLNWRPLKLAHATYAHGWKGSKHVYMHRLILGVVNPKLHVDHRDRDSLNNRRSNLREATPSQNEANGIKRKARTSNPSRHKGVYWDKSRSRWAVTISINGKMRGLGRFHDEDEAGRAYDRAAREIWGEFARLNFQEES